MNFTRSILLLSVIFSCAKCAKILGVFPSPGYSQFILAEKLMTELARRGHQVTVINPFKPKEDVKNYRPILLEDLPNIPGDELYQEDNQNMFLAIKLFKDWGLLLAEAILADQKVQQLIHSNETFDLVIVEKFENEVHMALAPHFKAPLIIFNSMGFSDWISDLVGNVRLPSVTPYTFAPYTEKMSFLERLHNTILSLFDTIYRESVILPQQQELVTKYFPNKMKLQDIMYNASLVLLNSHASTTSPATLTTAVKEIGGFHVSPKKLPNDIQKFLDEAKEGAILFSMGSNLKSADLPKDKLEGILNAFSKLKQRVLWKFEVTNVQKMPKNVFISKWMPQSDILAHPNIVVFITHGGLLSTTEAIHHGVPMVGIPVFGDQKMNVARSVQKQIAVHLPFKELSEKSLTAALDEILTNSKYSRNAKKLSSIFKDQVVKPLDLAMYWIEYVVRHGGAPHFRNASLELNWFQLYLLDIVGFLIICTVIFYYVLKNVAQLVVRRTKKNSKQKMN